MAKYFTVVVWHQTCNISEVCLYRTFSLSQEAAFTCINLALIYVTRDEISILEYSYGNANYF